MSYRDELEAATARADTAERRLRELERATKTSKAKRLTPRRVGWAMVVLGALLGIGNLVRACVIYRSAHPSPPSRSTPCYFVRHYTSQYEDESRGEPWMPWHVFKSPCEGCTNHPASTESFKSKAEAWRFIQYWKLDACR